MLKIVTAVKLKLHMEKPWYLIIFSCSASKDNRTIYNSHFKNVFLFNCPIDFSVKFWNNKLKSKFESNSCTSKISSIWNDWDYTLPTNSQSRSKKTIMGVEAHWTPSTMQMIFSQHDKLLNFPFQRFCSPSKNIRKWPTVALKY